MRRLTPALLGAGAACTAVLGAGPAPGPAPAAAVAAAQVPPHRAAVIVDTGVEVRSVCVRFAEESITGVEALQRAALEAVFRAFPGKGAAVCSLCGTGCPADESCLTCDPGGRFWSYSRAVAGTASLRVSGAGASSTTVRNGDVEGWRWGTGGTPPFASVQQVCGEAVPAATTSAPAAAPAPAAGPAATSTTAASSAPVPGPTATAPARITTTTLMRGTPPTPAGAPPGELVANTSTPTTVAGTTATMPSSPSPEASARASGTSAPGSGSSWAGLGAFAAVLTGLLAWGALARRRRRTAVAGDSFHRR